MPELPEVETMRRGVLPIVGSTIENVRAARCRLKPIRIEPALAQLRRLTRGKRIEAIQRIGKRVAVRLEDQQRLVFEPRMTGLLLLGNPPDPQHLRLQIILAGGPHSAFWFWDRRGLGSVRLLTPDQWEAHVGPARIGVDALNLSIDQLRAQLSRSQRAVKVALLDQRALAGVGNLYASELLHVAKVHPATPCNRVTVAQWRKIHSAMQHVLEEAIRYEGSTLSDGTYRNALNETGSYQQHHRVYARHGQSCRQCRRGIIQRVVQAQRSTFFCPHCQKQPNFFRRLK